VFLARELRWDAAEDLSHVTGDIAAERIVKFAGGARRQVRNNALHLAQALAEYWTEERPLISTARQVSSFGQGVTRLHDAIDALERRLDHLAKAR
jgi:ubiquinone biosynthesis accessory factor UbiJ